MVEDFSTSMEQYFLHGGTIYHQASFSLIIGRTRNAIYTEKVKTEVKQRAFFLLKLPVIRFLLLFLHFVIFRLEMRTEPTTYNLLSTITFPEDLRQLSVEELPEVCKELRQDIIKEVSCNPGHFAASLGTVELTVALHYVFNTPDDKIVWTWGIRLCP